MRQHELQALQNAIMARIRGNDSLANLDPFFGNQSTINLWSASDQKDAVIGYGGIADHDTVRDYLARIMAFYEVASPEDIAILNTKTSTCRHCGEKLTEDEFYPVTSTTGRVGIEIGHDQNTGEMSTIYCKRCIDIVPLFAFRKHRPGFIYMAGWNRLYKIGMSQNPEKRIAGLQSEYPGIELLHSISCKDMFATEAHVHSIYMHRHEFSEFFDLSYQETERIRNQGGEE